VGFLSHAMAEHDVDLLADAMAASLAAAGEAGKDGR
jgi:hypothetical protein